MRRISWSVIALYCLTGLALASGQFKSCALDVGEWTKVTGASVRSTRIQANFDTPVNTVQWVFRFDNGGVFNELYFKNCSGTNAPVVFSAEVGNSGCTTAWSVGAGSEPSQLQVEINNCSTALPASNPANGYRNLLDKVCYGVTIEGASSGGIESMTATCTARQGTNNYLNCSFDSLQTAVSDVYNTTPTLGSNVDLSDGARWVDVIMKNDIDIYRVDTGWYTTGNLVFSNECQCTWNGNTYPWWTCPKVGSEEWWFENGCGLIGPGLDDPVYSGQTVVGYRHMDFDFRCWTGVENLLPTDTDGENYYKVCVKPIASGAATFGGNCLAQIEESGSYYGCVTRPYTVTVVP